MPTGSPASNEGVNVVLVSHTTSVPNSLKPPRELIAFAERQIREAQRYPGLERRSERRNLMVLPVVAQVVDDDFQPINAPFSLVTRDISPTGIGLIHIDPFEEELLALQMAIAGEKVIVVVEVMWQRSIGPFYYSGAIFVEKLDHFPSCANKKPPSCEK